jgi:hypothetical protein
MLYPMTDRNIMAMLMPHGMEIWLFKKPVRNYHGIDLGWEALPLAKRHRN